MTKSQDIPGLIARMRELLLNVSQWDRWRFGGTREFTDGANRVKREVFQQLSAIIADADALAAPKPPPGNVEAGYAQPLYLAPPSPIRVVPKEPTDA